jgi:DNA-binding transcriptional LysR family regulator
MLNLSRFDLNLLVVFEAIYSSGGITRAGEQLNLTQSAISHALARLRELLGDKLFVREGHLMIPTPMAQELIKPVRRALAEIEGSLRQIETFDPSTATRPFRIGLRSFVETVILPPLVPYLLKRAPGITLSAIRHDRTSLEAMLAVGDIDIAIDVHLPRTDQLSMTSLWGGYMVVLARRGHPAFNQKLDLEAYLALDHIVASSRRKGTSIEDMALQRLGLERRVSVRCQNHATAGQIAARSDMVMTVPVSFAETLVQFHDLDMAPAPIDMPSSDLYLYWHPHLDKDPANKWLRAASLACLSERFSDPQAQIMTLAT